MSENNAHECCDHVQHENYCDCCMDQCGTEQKRPYKYDVYWDIIVDGEARNIKLKWPWESKLSDPDDVMLEVDEADLIGFDFEGYPEEPDDLEIIWDGFPIIVPIED